MEILNRIKLHHLFLIIIFLIALILRLWYSGVGLPDYWGDSYHNYYIVKATLENGLIYDDFKMNHFLWLPGFHYLGVLGMILLGDSLFVLHLINQIIGSICAVLVVDILFRVFKNHFIAVTSSFALFLAPWHIMYSTMFMPECWAGLCLLLMIRGWVVNSEIQFQGAWLLGIISRYELWFFGGLLVLLTSVHSKSDIKKERILYSTIIFCIWILLWSLWSRLGVGEGSYWLQTRISVIAWDRLFLGVEHTIFGGFSMYFTWIGYTLGLLGGILALFTIIIRFKSSLINQNDEKTAEENHIIPLVNEERFLIVITAIVLIRIFTLIVFTLVPVNDPRYVLIDLHLVVLLIPGWLYFVTGFKE
ncbi:MAG: hypothetical protein JSV04_10060, partial [Candidatus Heimdallarchaeota archaeon]